MRNLSGYHSYLAQQLSTQRVLPCTHGTCDNNGASSIEVWQMVFPEFMDSKLQITVQLAYWILITCCTLARNRGPILLYIVILRAHDNCIVMVLQLTS